MGRHEDRDTLNFIQWLKKKGNDLGYHTETECPIGHNDYYVDVVWKYRKEQIPLITFEVETTNRSRIFKNTMKIFGTKQSRVRKPLHHFMIVYKNSLTASQKAPLHMFLDHFNTSLYENVFNEPDKQKELENELDDLASNPLRERSPFLSLFRSNLLFSIDDIEYAFSRFGHDLPFLLKDDFVPPEEKHPYEKALGMIEHLKNRLYQIKSTKDVNGED